MDNRKRPRSDTGFFEGWEFNSWGEAIATLALMLIVCLGVGYFLTWAVVTADKQPYEYEDTVLYWVEEGDTLWTIARHYSTDRQDVRRVIDMIEELNDCTATIYPGQCLTIPVFLNQPLLRGRAYRPHPSRQYRRAIINTLSCRGKAPERKKRL